MKGPWPVRPLDELADVGAGNPAPQGDVNFADGTVPFFRTSDVGRVHLGELIDAEDWVNEAGAKGMRLHPAGTVLLPKSGASTYTDHRVIMARPGYVSSHLATVKANGKTAIDRYLFYALQTVSARDVAGDSSYPTLSLAQVRAIELPAPPLSDQQKIVAMLDGAFDAIGVVAANVSACSASAQLLEQIFQERLHSSEMPGWQISTIGEVCILRSGTTVDPAIEKPEGELPYLKVADMSFPGNEKYVSASRRYLDPNDVRVASVLPAGTTVFPKRGGAIATNKKRIAAVPICADLNVMGVIPGENIEPEFLFAYFQALDLAKLGSGSSIPQINNYDIAPLRLAYPTARADQLAFVEKVQAFKAQIESLMVLYNRKLALLADLKHSLLTEAFSGDVARKPLTA